MNPDQAPQSAEYDHGVSLRLGGVVLIALIAVFALQKLGFRFVVSAKTGISA